MACKLATSAWHAALTFIVSISLSRFLHKGIDWCISNTKNFAAKNPEASCNCRTWRRPMLRHRTSDKFFFIDRVVGVAC